MSTEKKKAPNPRPWMDVDPEPLPESDAALLDEVLEYAAQIADGEKALDEIAMSKASALERLYRSQSWSDEWTAARPPKPNAVGRPVEPTSRNRFVQWIAWRAEKTARPTLKSAHVYRLLKSQDVASYLSGRRNNYTEYAIRPLGWMVSRGYAERIPEVEQIAVALANGGPVTSREFSKALAEWKAKTLGPSGVARANRTAQAQNYRPVVEHDFRQLMEQDPFEAREFVKWAAAQLKAAAK